MATAIVLDVVVLATFLWAIAPAGVLFLYVSAATITIIVMAECVFMRSHTDSQANMDM